MQRARGIPVGRRRVQLGRPCHEPCDGGDDASTLSALARPSVPFDGAKRSGDHQRIASYSEEWAVSDTQISTEIGECNITVGRDAPMDAHMLGVLIADNVCRDGS